MTPILEDVQMLIRKIASKLLGERNFGCLPEDDGKERDLTEQDDKGTEKEDQKT